MDSTFTSEFPGFDRLYILRDPLADSPWRGSMMAENPVGLLRGELSPASPVRVERAMGGKPRDVIWTTWAGVFLVEKRICDLLWGSGISGWTTYQVQVTDQRGLLKSGYLGFAVTGRCGPIDESRAELLLKPQPVPEGRATWFRKGYFFEPESWDGSDVFCPEGEGTLVIVTERTKRLLEESKIRNLAFTATSECEVMALSSSLPGEFA